jgi:hypothetical protein
MFAIVPGPFFTAPRLALAPRRSTIEGALDDMGTGVVVALSDGHIAAFHETHLPVIERLGEIRGTI